MSTPLKIDFVSDVSCPWCVVGLYGLTRALEILRDEVQAEIRFQPFELNPKMGPEGQNITEHITEKYGSTPEQSQKNREMIRARGAAVGFAFRTDGNSRIYNTFDAHRFQEAFKAPLLTAVLPYLQAHREDAAHWAQIDLGEPSKVL